MNKNIFGDPILECSKSPLTGYFRNGCCDTDESDVGMHTVCVVATQEFLNFSKQVGNDLSTPIPQWNFEGVKAGDRWCLCALRWKEALDSGCAPKVDLESTNEKALKHVKIEDLIEHSYKVK